MLANERMTVNEAHAVLGVRQKQIRNTIEDGKRFARAICHSGSARSAAQLTDDKFLDEAVVDQVFEGAPVA